MKLEIYQPLEPRIANNFFPEPKPVFLRLVSQEDSVYVVACHSNGLEYSGGYLLKFTPDGVVLRPVCVNKSLGFQLDSNGSLIIGGVL